MDTPAASAPASGGAAPASAPAAPAAPAATDSSAGAPAAGGATQSSVATPSSPTTEAPAFPSADEIDWDSWDGSHDRLPEPIRPWGQKLQGHYTKTARQREAEATELRKLYEDLTSGVEDPRVAEGAQKLQELQSKYEAEKAQYEEKIAKYEGWRQQLEVLRDKQAQEYADNFEKKHAWIFDGGEVEKIAGELFDEGFLGEDLPVVLRLPPPMLEKVRAEHTSLRNRGVPNASELAIRLVRSEARFAPQPSEALQASTGNRVTTTTTADPGVPLDFESRRLRAVEKANKSLG